MYRSRNQPSYRAIYAFFGLLVVLAVAFTVYLFVFGNPGDRPWLGR